MEVGTNSATICTASAAAVLFMLTKDTSCVLRNCISIAVGGFGLNPAITKTIHAMPPHKNNAAKACNGTANSLSLIF
jgi:hypothetical protein